MRWIVAFSFLFLVWRSSDGQSSLYRIERFTSEDGLKSNTAGFILQDKLGYSWFRTEVGVGRFDGYEFTSFEYNAKDANTPFQKVQLDGLHLDGRGNIWVDYSGIGVSYFDQELDRFINFAPNDSLSDYIGNYDALSFYSNDENIVWIGTDQNLFQYDYRTQSFRRWDFGFDLPVKSMLVDNIGNLWLGTGVGLNYDDGIGLYLLDAQRDQLHKIGKGTEKINAIHQDSKGGIWLATNKGFGKVREYSPGVSNFSETHYVIKRSEYGSTADTHRNNVTRIFEDSRGSIWFVTSLGLARAINDPGSNDFSIKSYLSEGTPGPIGQIIFSDIVEDDAGTLWSASQHTFGLCQYDPEADEFIVNLDRRIDRDLSRSRIVSLFPDNQNVLWMGTERSGVFKLDLDQKRFNVLRHDPNNPNSLGADIVYGIDQDHSGNLWFGTSNGVSRYDRHSGAFEGYNTQNIAMNDDIAASILIDSQRRMWLGHSPNQVSRIDLQTLENTPFKYIIGDDTTGLFAWSVESIVEDTRKDIWISSHSGRIYRARKGEMDLQEFIFENHQRRNEISVNTLMPDSKGTIWVGTTYGLYHIKDTTAALVEFELYEGQELFREGVNTLTELSSGFWIGSQSSGLVRADLDSRKVTRFNDRDGLAGNSVKSILPENDSVLWVSTNAGISRFDLATESFTNYTTADGLPADNFLKNSALRLSDGTMYFGSVKGVCYFQPGGIDHNQYDAKPLITGVQLFHRDIGVGDTINGQLVLESSIASTGELMLNHRNNILSFTFSSMHFASPSNNKYAYKLDNLEEEWNYVDATDRTVSYTSLPHGRYIFRVRASNSDGRWSQQEATLSVVILPPWWNTTWFRLILLFLVIVLSYALYRMRVQNIRSRNKMLEKMVEDKTSDLKEQNLEIQEMSRKLHLLDQQKIRFFTNVSHEFRTPLTLIMGPIGNLINSPTLKASEKEEIRIVERNAHRLLRLTNQLLDANDLERDTLKLRVGEGDIVHFVGEIFSAFEYRAHFMDVNYRLDSNVDRYVGWFDGDKIEKILFNLISNAFKFTSKQGRITVKIDVKQGQMELSVADTGIGIEEHQLANIFERFYQIESRDVRRTGTGIGLNLAKKLAQKHHGDLTVVSDPGQGTTFKLNVPVGFDAFEAEERVEIQVDAGERAETIQKLFVGTTDGVDVTVTRPKSTYVVLIVEDSVDMRSYIKNALKSEYSVLEAKDGEEGIKLAQEMVPDLIISDVMMPKLDGMELCDRIKSSDYLSHIPIILLTAKVGEESQIDGYQAGADDYLTKPFDVQLLKVRVSNLISNRVSLRSHFERSADLLPDQMIEDRSDQVFMEKLVRVIEEHLSDPSLNYQHFVEELGIGKTKLYDRINKVAGQSINLFIRTIRLKKAAKLIEDKQLTFSEISYKVGFSDPSYFSKCFRQQFGVSPKEYQEQTQVLN
ncbi:MAG: ATP-binding protein [Bacteroidota bacterium]